MDKKQLESLSFEDSYSKLDDVNSAPGERRLNLEESVALYQEGMELAQRCGQHLDNAELRVTQLLSEAADDTGLGSAPASQPARI